MEQELCKYAFVASHVLNSYYIKKDNQREITSLVPRSVESFGEVNLKVEEYLRASNCIVLQTSIGTAPYISSSSFPTFSIPNQKFETFAEIVLESSRCRVFNFKYEFTNPSLILSGPIWRKNILKISEKFEVVLATAPLNTRNGVEDFSSLLGTLPAKTFEIVD